MSRFTLPLPSFGRSLIPCWTVLVLILAAVPLALGEEPSAYAITNARIIPVSSAPIEKGTVVLRGGLIVAFGASVQVPADARVIDGTGLFVYPGLFDALANVALPEPRAGGGSAPPGVAPNQQRPAQTAERETLNAHVYAADLVDPRNRNIERSRAAGITTALIVPNSGIFQGQSALINLSGSDAGRMVLKTPAAMHISWAGPTGFSGTYPASLMGILAYVRQTLMDAEHYAKAWSIYEAHPGAKRPEYNKDLQALRPALEGNMPFVLPGNSPAEIVRSLDIAQEFHLKMILSGGRRAGALADTLKQKRIPVILSLNFPEREADGDPELTEELATLRQRIEAPAQARALHQAGVPFAFASADISNPRDFVRNAARAVEAGLPKDAALRAMTLGPAEIFGVADRVGSIEIGKVANLILTSGDLFESRTRVKYVFVDGTRFEIDEQEQQPRTQERATPGGASLSGSWRIRVGTPQGPIDATLNLRHQGSQLSGTISSAMGTTEITEGEVDGSSLRFRITMAQPGGGTLSILFTAVAAGTTLTGTADAGEIGRMDFTGSRSPNRTLEP